MYQLNVQKRKQYIDAWSKRSRHFCLSILNQNSFSFSIRVSDFWAALRIHVHRQDLMSVCEWKLAWCSLCFEKCFQFLKSFMSFLTATGIKTSRLSIDMQNAWLCTPMPVGAVDGCILHVLRTQPCVNLEVRICLCIEVGFCVFSFVLVLWKMGFRVPT